MKKLLNLYIFRREDGICLYHHPFGSIRIDPQLISGFLSAVLTFMDEIIPTYRKESGTFSREDHVIIVEHGKIVSGALVATSEDADLRSRLKNCIEMFEDIYKNKISGTDKYLQEGIFDDFTSLVKRTFAIRIIEPFCTPVILKSPPKSYLESPATKTVINTLDGVKSVLEISLATKLPIEIVAHEILELMDEGFLDIKCICKSSDVYKLTKRGIRALNTLSITPPGNLRSNILLKILSEIDGIRTAGEIAKELKLPFNKFSEYIQFLHKEGFIEYITLHHLAILILKDVIDLLLANCLKYLGKSKTVDIFQLAKEKAKKVYARIETIELTNNMRIDFEDLKRHLTTSIIEDMVLTIKALTTLILNLRFHIRNLVGDRVDTAINENINTKISLKYSIKYMDILSVLGIEVKELD